LLEEVLWSALLLARAGHASELAEVLMPKSPEESQDFQASLDFQDSLVSACQMSPLPFSLQQRLEVELPELFALLGHLGKPNSAGPGVLPALRQARDSLLAFAAKNAGAKAELGTAARAELPGAPGLEQKLEPPLSATSGGVTPGDASHVKRRQVRRTSLSHWTEESLEQLEAPKSKGTITSKDSKGSKKCSC